MKAPPAAPTTLYVWTRKPPLSIRWRLVFTGVVAEVRAVSAALRRDGHTVLVIDDPDDSPNMAKGLKR